MAAPTSYVPTSAPDTARSSCSPMAGRRYLARGFQESKLDTKETKMVDLTENTPFSEKEKSQWPATPYTIKVRRSSRPDSPAPRGRPSPPLTAAHPRPPARPVLACVLTCPSFVHPPHQVLNHGTTPIVACTYVDGVLVNQSVLSQGYMTKVVEGFVSFSSAA